MKRNSKALCLLLAGAMVAGNCPVPVQATGTVETLEGAVQETVVDVGDEAEATGEVVEEDVNASETLTKGDFTYTEGTDGITITKYNGTDSTVNVGEVFAGETVVAIGNYAFGGSTWSSGNSNISEVILPDTVKSIGTYAFGCCSNIAKISFSGENVQLETIGENAFRACSNLTVFEIPETVKTIGKCAFQGCSSLTEIVIPENVLVIPSDTFRNCTGLRTVEMKSTTTTINSDAFSNCKSTLTFYGDANSTAETYASENGFRFNRYTDAITVKTPPTKTEYLYGEELNTIGFTLEVDYTSDTEPATEVVDASACNFTGFNPNKVGKQTITVSYAGKETTFDVNVYYDIVNANVEKIGDLIYNGSELTPELEITGKETTLPLVKDQDYTIEHVGDNTNAGTATIKIVGMGDYKGSLEKTYTINPTKFEGITVNDLPGYTYTGSAIKPAIAVKLGDAELVEDKDYTVSYRNNVNVGTATVYIEGKGNYEGTVEKTFDITPKSIHDIGIRDISDYRYTGEAIEPAVSLELDIYTVMTKGSDYTVSYRNNVNVGTATVQIQGIGNYTGLIEKTFKITPKTIVDASMVLSETTSNYDGTVKTPAVTVISGGKTLAANSEYTVTYRNNKNIGTATVTVTGIGNYTGTISKNFTIQAKKGSTLTAGSYKYKVTNASEVAFAGLKSSKTKKVMIPGTVKIGGKSFKVTSIANNALKGTAVTSVTVGKNVKTIGNSAFQKCSKLKKITVKGTALKKVGKNAFKGINAKAKIKVPKSKLSAYKKLMKGKGQSSTVKITK